MSNDSAAGGPSKPPSKLQIRYGVEDGESAPLLIFHPMAACLLAGLAAGLLAFAFGEVLYGRYQAPGVKRSFQGIMSDLPTPEAQDAAMVKNAAFADAGLGALLGLYLGLAGGLLRRDARRAATGGAVGLALGGLAGAAFALGALPRALRYRNVTRLDEFLVGTATQMLGWGVLGLVAGLAFGLAFGGRKTAPRFAFYGLLGAMVGTLIYAAAGAAFFPLADTDRPVALERGARLLSRLFVSLGAGALVGLSLTGRHRRSQPWIWQRSRPAEFPGTDGG